MSIRNAAASAAAIVFGASGALAQVGLGGTNPLDTRIADVQAEAAENLARGTDPGRFGAAGVPQGFSGSFALTGNATSGNTDNLTMSGAGRVSYGLGLWTHSLGFGVEYGEAGDVRNESEYFLSYDVTRELGPQLYGFGLARYEYDEFGPLLRDGFFGAGIGYRIMAQDDLAWRVQLGAGMRYVEDQAGLDETERAIIAGSRFYYAFNDMTFVTNDTDILHSETGTLVKNELGLNFRVSDMVTTRMSYVTDYTSEPAPGFASTDNKLGLSIIYAF